MVTSRMWGTYKLTGGEGTFDVDIAVEAAEIRTGAAGMTRDQLHEWIEANQGWLDRVALAKIARGDTFDRSAVRIEPGDIGG